MSHLSRGEGFLVPDVLQVYLYHLKRFSAVPVHKGPGCSRPTTGEGGGEAVTVPTENVTDGGPGEFYPFIFGQVEGEALGSQAGLIPDGDDLLLQRCWGFSRLVVRSPGSILQLSHTSFPPYSIYHRAGDAESPSCGRHGTSAAQIV